MAHRRIISKHFLKRRAEAHAKQIRRWQRAVREPTGQAKWSALDRLNKLGITPDDLIAVESTGRFDRRHYVYVPSL